MKKSASIAFLKYAVLFVFGLSAVYFASAYTTINTTLTNATQFIQKIILTDDGNQSGVTGIVLDGLSGDVTINHKLRFLNALDNGSYTADIIGGPLGLQMFGGSGNIGLTVGNDAYGFGYLGLLHDTNDDGNRFYVIVSTTGNSIAGKISFQQNAGDPSSLDRYVISHSGEHHWYTSNSGVYAIERMTIVDNGNVGIGTSTPTDNKLQIEGNISSRGFIARGIGVSANGTGATAMGNSTQANGDYSTAMGNQTEANGDVSTTMGMWTQADGLASLAMGDATHASGDYSTAMGYDTIANGHYSTALGKYNVGLPNSIFEIGIGNTGSRLNAITVLVSGNVGIGNNNPQYPLHVDGSAKVDGTFFAHEARFGTLLNLGYNLNVDGGANIDSWLYVTGSRVGIGTSTPSQALEVNGNIQMSFPSTWIGQIANQVYFASSGKVGIDTASPDALLTVEGGIRPIKLTSTPCGNTANYPEGTMFYNSTSHYYCFCNGSGSTARKIADESVSCF